MKGPVLQRGALLTGHHGEYVVEMEAGRGGVGCVFKARNINTGQIVAIKVLHSARFELSDVQRERFQIEIETTLSIQNEHIVNGLDYGIYHTEPFLVLEWMDGGTLQNYIATTDYEEPVALRILSQLLKAFRALQSIPLVHRDIKPNNIFLKKFTSEDRFALKLGDLGIARNEETAHLTLHGDQMGSLLYITDRQRRNPCSSSSRDDFYSLALVMYEVATRRRIHTRNPALAYWQPSRVPRPVCYLIDWAMEDRDNWIEIFEEMTKLIDLDNECICAAFPGSRMTPSLLVSSRISVLTTALDLLTDKTPAAAHQSSLLTRVAAKIVEAFNETAQQLTDVEVSVFITDCIVEDDILGMGAGFLGSLAERLDKADILEGFNERSSAWIRLRERGNAVEIVEIGSKRISIDESFLEDLNFENLNCEEDLSLENVSHEEDEGGTLAVFRTLDDVELASLRRIGQGLAIGLAVGAVAWVSSLAGSRSD